MKRYTVLADFGRKEPFPLIKSKFGFFNSAYVPYDRWMRDVDLLEPINPVSVRYEVGWGMGTAVTELNGNRACPQEYDAPQMDGWIASLNQRNIQPFLINCYTPEILQKDGGDYTSVPADLEKWRELNYACAKHFREKGLSVPWYEIWNEPDLDVFFGGTMEEFFEVYASGAEGVRSADPDARIGGPALSVTDAWARPFLDYVTENRIPLDFYSFHMFAVEDQDAWIQEYRSALSAKEELKQCEFILSEYNPLSFQKNGKDFNGGGYIEGYEFAQEVLHQIRYFLAQPDIGMVNWAQFHDPSVFGASADRCGVVSTEGERKPSWYAFAIYADMPIGRRRLTVDCNETYEKPYWYGDRKDDTVLAADDGELEGMASSDDHRAAVCVWNRGNAPKSVKVVLSDIPFRVTRGRLFRIDQSHCNFLGREKDKAAVWEEITWTEEGCWQGEIPARGVIYLVADDGYSPEQPAAFEGKIVRTLHYYEHREEKTYAFFEQDASTVFLHLEKADSRAVTGLLIEDTPEKIRAEITLKDSAFCGRICVRLDYLEGEEAVGSIAFVSRIGNSSGFPIRENLRQDAQLRARNKRCAAGVTYRGVCEAHFCSHADDTSELPAGQRSCCDGIPWGSGKEPDQFVEVCDREFDIPVKACAPEGWVGERVILTFEMSGGRAGDMAEVRII